MSVVVNIAPDGVVFTLDFRPRQASQAAAIVGLFERAGAALADTRVSVAGSTGSKLRYSRICRDISKDVRVEVKAVQVWQPCRMQYPYDEPRTQSASMGRLRKYCYTAGAFLDQSSAGLSRSFLRRAWGPVIGSLRLSFTNFTSLSYLAARRANHRRFATCEETSPGEIVAAIHVLGFGLKCPLTTEPFCQLRARLVPEFGVKRGHRRRRKGRMFVLRATAVMRRKHLQVTLPLASLM